MSDITSITYDSATAIAPSDATAQGNSKPYAALYVGVTGDVTVILAADNTAVLFKAVPAGVIVPVAFKWVKSTGTTATNLLGLRAKPFLGNP